MTLWIGSNEAQIISYVITLSTETNIFVGKDFITGIVKRNEDLHIV